ncbi:MAG: LysM peptidoglycan-binding domain-containing protein [Spirochaetaceae bacterium]|jgi:hypothetical protein|nr:LysM peptidoglycan-binding domain-containing protein [Spirochaetaceae bacterium]
MGSTIGIKTANGEFYPILEENSAVEKRLILTTVHNKQASVHIDLYKSDTRTITEEGYIGSLVVEHIRSKPRGEPSIELVISANEAGEIIAEAADLDAEAPGTPQRLKVSLKTIEPERDEPPDFALGYGSLPPPGLYDPPGGYGFPWKRAVIVILALIAIGFGIWCFLLGGFKSKVPEQSSKPEITLGEPLPVSPELAVQAGPQALPKPEIPAALSEPEPEPEPAEEPEPEPAIAEATLPPDPPVADDPPIIEAPVLPPRRQSGVNRTRPSPPVASYKVPAIIPRGGVPYKIRWGDTLWDISEAFYRNPWLYPRIARFNKIRNPDLIISGTTIRVPPRR